MKELAMKMYFLIYSDDIEGLKAELVKEPSLLYETYSSETWLNLAASYGRLEMIRLLTSMGLEPDGENGKMSVLESALSGEAKSMEAFELLLSLGAQIDGLNGYPAPLARAISTNNFDAFIMLLDRGARTDIHWGAFNYNPMTYAQSHGEEGQHFVDELIRRGVPVEQQQEKEQDNKDSSVDGTKDFYATLKQFYGELEKGQVTRIVTESNISVRHIKAYDESCQILVSDGMRHAIRSGTPSEIMLLLPFAANISPSSIKDSDSAWSFNFLLNLAEYLASMEGLVQGEFFTIDLGQPIAKGSALSILLVLGGADEYLHFEESGVTGNIYKIIPIHAEEFAFYQDVGLQALIQELEKNNASMVIDPMRKSVVLS